MKTTLVALALFVILASPAVAQTTGATVIPEVTIGTAVRAGQSFVIVLDEGRIDSTYPAWSRPLLGTWTSVVTKEQFRAVVRDVVSRKLAAMFPEGLPPDAASGVEIKVRLGKSPEIIIGC